MKNKIVFINFWPYGGMRHYSDSLVQLLSSSFHVTYICNYNPTLECSLDIVKVDLNPTSIFRAFGVIKLIGSIKPDIVQLNSGYPALILTYPLFYFYKSYVVIHDVIPHEGEKLIKKLFHKIQLRFFITFFSKLFVHSNELRLQLPASKRRDVIVIPHVNIYITKKGGEKKQNRNVTEILFFGRILRYKGLDVLLRAMTKLPSNFHLTIAGEGSLDSYLINDSTNVTIINRYITESEMSNLFESTDIVIVPYKSASQSGVIYRAFAHNKPVIATRVGALPKVVNDEITGLLINPDSSQEIIDSIYRLSNHSLYEKIKLNIIVHEQNNNLVLLEQLKNAYADSK
jgi:starch synthase